MYKFLKTVLVFLSFQGLVLALPIPTIPSFNSLGVVSNNVDTTKAKGGEILIFTLTLDVAETSSGGTITFDLGAATGLTATIPASGVASLTHQANYTVLAGENGAVSVTGIAFQNVGTNNIINLPVFAHTPVPNVTVDTTKPTLAEVTPVPALTADNTPDYTFSSTEIGNIAYGGDCVSVTTTTSVGNNTVTFSGFGNGNKSNCTIVVTDQTGNQSDTLNISTFFVDQTAPVITFADDTVIGPVLTESLTLTATDNNVLNGGSLEYGFSADAVCDITDVFGNAFVSGVPFVLNTEAQNGKFICAKASDTAGNTSFLLSANVLNIDATNPDFQSLGAVSNNAVNTLAKAGDVLTFTLGLTTSDTATGGTLTFSVGATNGLTTTFPGSASNLNHTATYTVLAGQNGALNITGLSFTDSVGNAITNFVAGVPTPNVTVDTLDPTLTPVTIISNNADITLAKTNDTLTVNFTGSETLENVSGTLFGEPSTITNTGGDNWTSVLLTNGNEAEGNVAFTLNFEDQAGNTGTQVITTTNGSNVRFDRTDPMVNTVSITSNNAFYLLDVPTRYGKVADILTLTFEATETIQTPTGTLLGKAPTFVNTGGNTWTATVAGTGGDTEGTVVIDIDVVDLAGNNNLNIIATTDGSSVIYDTTNPTNPTSTLDNAGTPTVNLKPVSDAIFTWSNDDDLTAGVGRFEGRFENTSLGINESQTLTIPTRTFTPVLVTPDDNDYNFYINTFDKAGNQSGETLVYTQKYGPSFSGIVKNSDGTVLANTRIQVVAGFGNACNGAQNICTAITDANGNYSLLVEPNKTYKVTYFGGAQYALAKQDITMPANNLGLGVNLKFVTDSKSIQTLDQSIVFIMDKEFLLGALTAQTRIIVHSFSGEADGSVQSDGSLRITSFGQITDVTSNNAEVVITNLGNNVFTVVGAGNILQKTDTFTNSAKGVFAIFTSGQTNLGQKKISASGRSGSYTGSLRSDRFVHGKTYTYEESLAAAERSNRGTPSKVLSYVNRNGYTVFAGYQSGRMRLARFERAPTQVIYRGGDLEKFESIKALAQNNKKARSQYRNRLAGNTGKNRYHSLKTLGEVPKGFKKMKTEDAVETVITKRQYLAHTVNKYKIEGQDRTQPSRIMPKNLSYIHLRGRNGERVALSELKAGKNSQQQLVRGGTPKL